MAKDFFSEEIDWDDLGDDPKKGKKQSGDPKDPGNGGFKNMFLKVFVEFEGDRYDFFEIKSIQRDKEYNEDRCEMDYLIVLNKTAGVKSNTAFITYKYKSLGDREKALKELYSKLDEISLKIGGESYGLSD